MLENTYDKIESNLPYTILRLGLACNANCLFCNVPPESYSLKEMSTQEAKKEIARLASSDKQLRLDISGGEPTIRKDLIDLINHASKNNIKTIQVQTNAILLSDKAYARKLKSVGLNKLFVSLHSSMPKIHDSLVGLKGAFKRCVEGIKNSLELNIEVALNPVITTKSYKHLLQYIKFVKNNFPQIKSISLSVVQPRGRAWRNSYLVPCYKTISPYIKEVLEISKKNGIVIYNPPCGVPLCIGNWYLYLERCVEYYDNLLRLKQGIKNNRFNEKVKPPTCFLCDLDNFCNGVWKEYAALYPLSDLNPIHLK